MKNIHIIDGGDDDDHYISDDKLHLEGTLAQRTSTTKQVTEDPPPARSTQRRGIKALPPEQMTQNNNRY